MGRHAAANFGLFADDHGLENARVFEVEVAGDCGVLLVDRGFGEGGIEVVEVVANLVDGAVFGLVEGAVCIEGICFKALLESKLMITKSCDSILPSSKKKRTLSPLSRK